MHGRRRKRNYLEVPSAPEIKRLYESGMSMTEVMAATGESYLIVRRVLIAYGAVRSMADSQANAIARGKYANRKRRTWVMSPEARARVSDARRAWGAANAKGSSIKDGYIVLTTGGDVGRGEHRTVMESILGRKLLRHEVVHHRDMNRSNNDPSNLQVMSRSDHTKLHQAMRKDAK